MTALIGKVSPVGAFFLLTAAAPNDLTPLPGNCKLVRLMIYK